MVTWRCRPIGLMELMILGGGWCLFLGLLLLFTDRLPFSGAAALSLYLTLPLLLNCLVANGLSHAFPTFSYFQLIPACLYVLFVGYALNDVFVEHPDPQAPVSLFMVPILGGFGIFPTWFLLILSVRWRRNFGK